MDPVASLFGRHYQRLLEQDNRTPLYHQLFLLLKGAIVDGTVSNGAQMPTELQLADSFAVSRITAKRAMDELAGEGLVERRRGKGTHVTFQYRPQPVKAPLVGMLEELETMARHTQAQVLTCEQLPPPAEIRREFDLQEGERLLHLVRVRLRDGKPFGYYRSWTMGVEREIDPALLERTPRLQMFRDSGLILTHVAQMISAVGAPPDVAAALGVDVGAPLLSLLRRSYDDSGGKERLVDRLEAYYHPERFQYRMDLKV
ncbi:MAG: GntR family transcriptional regulator [Pseudomonadota bacterium]